MKLLIQLEDSRWACCARCQKLHPRGEFYEMSLVDDPTTWMCTWWAGLIDICPCLTLTLRSRKQIMEYLMRTVSDAHNINLVKKGLLEKSSNARGEKCLLHKCSADSTVILDAIFSLSDGDNPIACTQFEVPSAIHDMKRNSRESVHVCHGADLWDWISRSNDEQDGGRCLAHLSRLDTPESTVVAVTQSLGKGIWPGSFEADSVLSWLRKVRST